MACFSCVYSINYRIALKIFIVIQSLVCFEQDCLSENCTQHNSVDLPLIDKLEAPLKAELDITALHKQIRKLIQREVQDITRKFNLTWQVDDTQDEKIQYPLSYGFHAQLTHDVPLGKSQTVIFDKIITNIGNAYNSHTGIFTAKRDGLYYFSATFLEIGTKSLHLQMIRNKDEISRGHAPSSNAGAGSMNAFIVLRRDDVVFIRHYAPLSSLETIHGKWSFFTGYFVSNT